MIATANRPAAQPEAALAKCPVCEGVVPSHYHVNCSRACTVRAADRRRRGYPISDKEYADLLALSSRARRATVQLDSLRAVASRLRAQLAKVEARIVRLESEASS